ncbi:MAG: DUF4203 domain-containing protein [Anaerolineaceae bacterium]|nr:DUF4203 domain-containing protein [Anaerolineaceae bacterium]
MAVLTFIMGTFLLVFGKKLLTFSIAIVGFYISFTVIPVIFNNIPDTQLYIASGMIGLLLVFLSRFVEKTAIFIVGMLGGGIVSISLPNLFQIDFLNTIPQWALFLIGGCIGIFAASFLFDWILMLLTTFLGAYLLLNLFSLPFLLNLVFYIVLCLIGILFQYKINHKEPLLKVS